MECSMLTAEYIAAVKVAIEICNNPELKRAILHVPWSVYKKPKELSNHIYLICDRDIEVILYEKSGELLKQLALPEILQEKLTGLVLYIGTRMLSWALYHEVNLGLSHEYCINFLNSSFFTPRGIIDDAKAAEVLIKDERLSTKQKYILACLHCFTDHIPVLYSQLTKNDQYSFFNSYRPQNAAHPRIVKFWSYYLIGGVYRLTGGKSLELYRLEKAIQSGILAAVQYSIEQTEGVWEKNIIIRCAIYALKIVEKSSDCLSFYARDRNNAKLCVPKRFYIDILCYLTSKMTEDQRIEFLKTDIESSNYANQRPVFDRHSRVLERFLNWPYQDYFLKNLTLVWEFLPETSYAILLVRICDKIEYDNETFACCHGKIYDYRGLLNKVWCKSPEHFKNYILRNPVVTYRSDTNGLVKKEACAEMLIKLVSLKTFTFEDVKFIRLILSSATDKEKVNIIFSKAYKTFCVSCIQMNNWKILDRFMINCFSSKEQGMMFKKRIFTEEAHEIIFDFMEDDNSNAADTFLKWSSLCEEEINEFKEKIPLSYYVEVVISNGLDSLEDLKPLMELITWCGYAKEKTLTLTKQLMKNLVFDTLLDVFVFKCKYYIIFGKNEDINELIHFCLSSAEEREFKRNVAYKIGCKFCVISISPSCDKVSAAWEIVEKLLTWCFSSEEEINKFKKEKLLQESGKKIHFNLINANRFEEAETFFAWLGLSAEEVKILKKETLFYLDEAGAVFKNICDDETEEERTSYGSKQEAVELLLRWYLVDKEAVLEFKDKFRSYYINADETEKVGMKDFNLLIENRLRDLDQEQMGVKRKSETFSVCKKICN